MRNLTLAITGLSCLMTSSDFRTHSPPSWNPLANHPHMEELPQLPEGLQHLAVVLQSHPNPKPKEEPLHRTMQANITMALLQDIPTLDGQDSSKLEDCFMDIETTTEILTRSHTHLAEAKTYGLTHTLFCGTLQAGKPWDIRISNNSSLPDIATSTVPLQCPSTYWSYPLPAVLLQTLSPTPHNNAKTCYNDGCISVINISP